LWSTSAVIAFLGAALHAGWLAPAYVGTHPSQEPSLTVLQLNTRFGEAAPAEVVRLARSRSADVVVLEELDAAAVSRLAAAGLGKVLPHRVGDANRGTMIFSRWPLRHARQLPVSKGAVLVQVAAPRPFWVIGLHTTQPAVSSSTWAQDLHEARVVAGRQSGPGLVVGDFNATLDHGPVRLLLQSGLHDAAEAGDAGWQPTWPSSGGGRPLGVPMPFSLFALDHVLVTRHIGVVTTRALTVDGTDHKALVASLLH
jgi:endonuclease/exonuclease/phosphatase (EEP) superfamily protein YafD